MPSLLRPWSDGSRRPDGIKPARYGFSPSRSEMAERLVRALPGLLESAQQRAKDKVRHGGHEPRGDTCTCIKCRCEHQRDRACGPQTINRAAQASRPTAMARRSQRCDIRRAPCAPLLLSIAPLGDPIGSIVRRLRRSKGTPRTTWLRLCSSVGRSIQKP